MKLLVILFILKLYAHVNNFKFHLNSTNVILLALSVRTICSADLVFCDLSAYIPAEV